MKFYTRIPVFDGKSILRPNGSLKLSCMHHLPRENYSYRLRLVGEVEIFPAWRCGSGIPTRLWYRSIEDALRSDVAYREKYSLYLAGQGETYPRNAYLKISELLATGCKAEVSFWVKTRRLRFVNKGSLSVTLEIYHQKEGRHPLDIYDYPDETVSLRLNPGTNDWTVYKKIFFLNKKTTVILVKVGGSSFCGEVWFGSPHFSLRQEENLIPPFCPANPFLPQLNWLGENLSRKEWPEF